MCSLGLANTQMALASALLPGGVCNAELRHPVCGMGSVSTGREETWGQRNSSWQGQLQAAETKGRD